MRRRGVTWALGALSLSGLGCNSFDEPARRTFTNDGTVCLQLGSGTLAVDVHFPTCLSSSCDRVVDTGCGVRVADGVITVTSHGTIESTGDSACTTDCGALTANCTAESIEPGTYTLVHGANSTTFVLGEARQCAFNDGFGAPIP